MEVATSLLLLAIFAGFVGCAPRIIEIPSSIQLGSASSSYQIEGAWNEDGKSENIWDRFLHQGHPWEETGDISCDSYHKLDEDVEIIKHLDVEFYRFSLSWSRILPSGFSNKINQAGVNYYNNLIDRLQQNNITVMITLYHWDLPQSLQDLGGFANPLIANWLEDYARVAFSLFGDRVKLWISINEPKQICNLGYGCGQFAPGYNSSGVGEYICSKNVLIAHARVYHLYNKFFKPTQKGKLGLVTECSWSEPATNKTDDIEAAERRRQFDFALYTHAVYSKNGDYPKMLKDVILKRSLAEGFKKSRLPELSSDEIDYIKGTYDFFGLNHYTTILVSNRKADPIGEPALSKDLSVTESQDDSWLTGSIDYFRLVPWGLRKALNYIKTNYDNPDIYITESGFPDLGGIQDKNRTTFFQKSLEAVLDAVAEDNVSVKAYTVWSLMDNYEWRYGYKHKFGLYEVDFESANKTRTPKASVEFFKNLIRTRKVILD